METGKSSSGGISRRAFLKTGAAVAGTAVLAGSLDPGLAVRSWAASPSKRLSASLTFQQSYPSPGYVDGWKRVAQAYRSVQPGVKITFHNVPYPDTTLVQTELVGGTAPEIIFDEPGLNAFAVRGLFTALDSYLGKVSPYTGRRWIADFKQPYLDQSRATDGKLYMLPWALFGVGMFYNKTQFDRLHLQPPTIWNQWMAVNAALKKAGLTPQIVAVSSTDAQTLWPLGQMVPALLRPKSQQIHLKATMKGWKYNYRDPRSVIAQNATIDELYVAFLKGLIDPAKAPEFKVAYQLMKQDSHFWEPGFLSYNGNDVYTAFSGGQSMQFMNGTWFIPTLEGTLKAFKALGQTNKVFQPGAFPYPTITPENTPLLKMGGINQNNGPRNGFWIPRHLSPDKLAAAIDFLQFLTAPKNVALAYGVVVNTEQTVAGKKLMTKVPAIGDPPAIKGVPYRIAGGAFQALTPRQVYADLGGPSPISYDTQSFNEFMAAWQQYLGGNMAIDAFLHQVSQSHLKALERVLRQQASTVDWNFVNSQLKGIPHISH